MGSKLASSLMGCVFAMSKDVDPTFDDSSSNENKRAPLPCAFRKPPTLSETPPILSDKMAAYIQKPASEDGSELQLIHGVVCNVSNNGLTQLPCCHLPIYEVNKDGLGASSNTRR